MRFFFLAFSVTLLLGCVVVPPTPSVNPTASAPSASPPPMLPSVEHQGPPVLRLEPAYPCGEGPVVVSGAGFSSGKVSLEFQSEATRFSIVTAVAREVSADANGTFRYEFSLQDPQLELLRPGARTWLRAFEQGSQRAEVPLPVCAQELKTALEAPSQAFEEVMRGQMSIDDATPPSDTIFDTAVIRSRADLALALDRHGFMSSAVEQIPQLDFERQTGLLSVVRLPVKSVRPEIVAITLNNAELVIHTVAWLIPSPLFQEVTFHYVAIPKTDASLRFAPLAYGWSTQRHALKPALAQRRPPLLFADDRTGKVEVVEAGW